MSGCRSYCLPLLVLIGMLTYGMLSAPVLLLIIMQIMQTATIPLPTAVGAATVDEQKLIDVMYSVSGDIYVGLSLLQDANRFKFQYTDSQPVLIDKWPSPTNLDKTPQVLDVLDALDKTLDLLSNYTGREDTLAADLEDAKDEAGSDLSTRAFSCCYCCKGG